MLNAFGAAWVQIDEPKFQFSIRQNYLPNVKTFYYMRLHGRNVTQWWRHDTSEDRYNYLYSGKELKEFSDIAGAAQTLVKKSYLYTNNHFAAKSVVNAVMLKAQLGEPIEGEYPPELIESIRRSRTWCRSRVSRPLFQAPQVTLFALCFTIARLMTSGMRSFSTTSIPKSPGPIRYSRCSAAAAGAKTT